MKVSYDRETDALYLRFADTSVAESEEIADGVILDFDAHGKIVGFEFLDTSTRLSAGSKLY